MLLPWRRTKRLSRRGALAGVVAILLSTAVLAEGEAVLLRPPDAGAVKDLERLRAETTGRSLEAAWDPVTGRVRGLDGELSIGLVDEGLASACLRFLSRSRGLFGWDEGIELRLDAEGEGLGTAHLRFGAYIGGVPVIGSRVSFHIDLASGGTLLRISARLYPHLNPPRDAFTGGLAAPALSARAAIRIAQGAVAPAPALRKPTRAQLAVFPLPAPGRLAYEVAVDSISPRGLFLVRVDASNGEVISSGDLIRYGAPQKLDGGGNVFVVSPIVSLRNPDLRDMDDSAEAVPLEAYTRVILPELDGSGGLSGPYVDTGGTPRAVRRVRLEFPFLRDHDGFEEVMLYYHIDAVQRLIQSLGFTSTYNLPIRAYANSEPPGVPYTDPQAYYLPDFDTPGRGELAFGSAGVDFAEDPEVIAHEYGHALQFNQVPGFGRDFDQPETPALGEGWADFLSVAYLLPYTGGYGDACLGEWVAAGVPPELLETPGCFRRLDSTKHYPDDLTGEPHADGEMWSASLGQVLQVLGREDSLKLVLQSHFFLDPSPSFADAAAAVLRADRQLFAGANEDLLTRVFTERGFLAAPLSLTWFYVARHAPAVRLPEDGSRFSSKLRLLRPGVLSAGSTGLPIEVYVSLAHPFPGDVEMVLRSPSGTALLLNDAGSRLLPAGPMVFGSALEPQGDPGSLAGEPVSGVWTLQLRNFALEPGTIAEWGLRFQGFLRGDVIADGILNVSDAVVLLEFLFRGGEATCPKAGDFDDDGVLNVSDAIGLLSFIAGLGPAPPEPYPEVGEDLTEDELTCGG